jgi:hypothetical protein
LENYFQIVMCFGGNSFCEDFAGDRTLSVLLEEEEEP